MKTMETNSIHGRLRDRIDELRTRTDDELTVALQAAVRITAEQLLELAAIVRVLEERGHNLTSIKLGLLFYVRRIAYEQMLPELVVCFQGHPSILRRVAAFALPDQERLLSDNTIPLVVVNADGKPSNRMCRVLDLAPDEARQVFAADHIRDEAEQIAYLRKGRKIDRARTKQTGVVLDTKRGGITVSGDGVFIPAHQLSELLAKLLSR